MAAKHGVPQTFTDYERMLAQVQPDVVVVLTPNFQHRPMALAALEAEAHVICEKPLALNVAEAKEMLAKAEGLARRHMTFFTYRGLAATSWIKRLLDQGYLGRLHHASASYLHGSWLDPKRPANWKTSRVEAGSGVLADLGAHVIDLLRWWFGEFSRVSGSLQTFIRERPDRFGKLVPVETDDAAALVAEFAGGGQTTVQLSRVSPERHNYMRIELYGSEGTLVLEYEQALAHLGRVSGARRGEGGVRLLPIPADLAEGLEGQDTFPALHARVVKGFFSGESGYPTFADGLGTQRVIDAVLRSAERRTWEAVIGLDRQAGQPYQTPTDSYPPFYRLSF